MLSVTKFFTFEAAHTLKDHPGLCKNLHGHSYKLEVEVVRSAGPNVSVDMVCDFGDLKAAVAPVVEKMDHSYLNDIMGMDRPTAENMVEWIRQAVLWPKGIRPVRIRLWETSTSYAEWKAK